MSGRTGIMYLLLNNFKNSVPIFDVISPAPKMYKGIWQIREKTKCPMLILWII